MTKIDLIACLVLFFGIRATQAAKCLTCDKNDPGGISTSPGPPRKTLPIFQLLASTLTHVSVNIRSLSTAPSCYPPAVTFPLFPLGSWEICDYEWYGTAPFCSGSCGTDDGVVVATSDNPNWCPDDTRSVRVTGNRCVGCGGSSCWSGHKVLCKHNCVGVVQQT